jgi:hypothetical protein
LRYVVTSYKEKRVTKRVKKLRKVDQGHNRRMLQITGFTLTFSMTFMRL